MTTVKLGVPYLDYVSNGQFFKDLYGVVQFLIGEWSEEKSCFIGVALEIFLKICHAFSGNFNLVGLKHM
jgi:hypothetical protein